MRDWGTWGIQEWGGMVPSRTKKREGVIFWPGQQAKYPKNQLSLVAYLLRPIMQRQYHPPSPKLHVPEPEKVPGSKGGGKRKSTALTGIFGASPLSVPTELCGCCFWRAETMFFCPMYFVEAHWINGLINKLGPFYNSTLGDIESYSRFVIRVCIRWCTYEENF